MGLSIQRNLSLALALVMASSALGVADQPYHGIPYKPDPPPAIDGRLDEWTTVPNVWQVNTHEQVTYGRSKWTSPRDLSATVWLAYRGEHLYLAVRVIDDVLRQTQRGADIWRGDHIELYVDTRPDLDPSRSHFAEGQYQFGFSPGNFQRTGDPLVDMIPEAVVFRPEGLKPEGMRVAAQKTEDGYTLEAAIPWSLMKVQNPAQGVPLGIEVGVSDTDGVDAVQEKMMTLLTKTWEHQRSRLVPCVLAPADGRPPEVTTGISIADSAELKSGERRSWGFDAPTLPKEKEAVITLKGRLQAERVSGYTACLRLLVNDSPVSGDRLLDRPQEMIMADGRTQPSWRARDSLTVPYAPDFDSTDSDLSYGLRNVKASAFAVRVTDLVHVGKNTLTIENTNPGSLTNALVTAEAKLSFRAPVKPPVKKGPPMGPLPVFEPVNRFTVPYDLANVREGELLLKLGGQSLRIESQFSTPEPAWRKGSNKCFRFERRIEKKGEAAVIVDTFENLTDENLPLMQRHQVQLGKDFQKVWLAGLSPATLTGATSDPANPTAYGITKKVGVGLLAIDDVFRVHVTSFSGETFIGLADNNLVLKPHAQHKTTWAVLPTPQPDFYDFVNAGRRLLDVNFQLDGSFCFLRADPRTVTDKWTDEQFTNFIRFKNAKFVCDSNTYPTYKGLTPHGTSFQTLDWTYLKKQMARLRTLVPESTHLIYFHCFLDVLDDADKKYPDDRVLLTDGTQADYGEAYYKIFFPTEENRFGKDIGKNVDIILDDLHADGVYWDEMEYSRCQYHYGQPWDGVSADIDPGTMKIRTYKSSVTFITQPWRLAMAKRILARGPLIANGAPHTQTMAALHFPHFTETGSIGHCTHMYLSTPIALGDHLTERSEVDAYHVMLKALNYGCVYYWYDDVHVGLPTYPHLTSYMFPITPLELHEGFVIAKERIVTNRSGLFGWGDNSRHEVHVFDDQGREVTPADRLRYARAVERRGRTCTELRIAEGWSAAILRHSQ